MKLYLSSYRLGNHPENLKELIGNPKAKIAVSINALDNYAGTERTAARLRQELEDIKSLGYIAEHLDLREYFDNQNIVDTLKTYDGIWFSGGNTFLLAKTFKQSGFHKVFDELIRPGHLVYSGYSAAFCVLAPSLKGVELVDDKDAHAEGYERGEIWEGIGLIDFYPVVHFRSNHHESDDVEKEYEYIVGNKIKHKTFKDGDVYVLADDKETILT